MCGHRMINQMKRRLKMDPQAVAGRSISDWLAEYPLLSQMMELQEVFWVNPGLLPACRANETCELTLSDILDASQRWSRFAPYFMTAFPETRATHGILESPLRKIPKMKKVLEQECGRSLPGELFLKMDSHLPISGSIKARGGIYEVLKFAEDTAMKEGLLHPGMGYEVFASAAFRKVFSKYSVSVGSTGNLGLSIGIISAALGFHVTVHMSRDAQQWKKDLLRSRGAVVIEHKNDYTRAVTEGRTTSKDDPFCHFVDDENSRTLFLGYAVAALRLEGQLKEKGIPVDRDHPLFLYLPCGVGGGPGGICFGMKQVFLDNAHCFFAEPTHAPSMLLGLYTGCHDMVSVQDFGIDNRTAADGLAVGRPSSFVGKTIQPYLSGAQTITDEHMHRLLYQLSESESIRLEPSALAGMYGPVNLTCTREGRDYLHQHNLTDVIENGTHIVWGTGGSMVPDAVMQKYLSIGRDT